MQEIKCPKCGEVFQVDESGYAAIVKQVRDKEFEKEVQERENAHKSEKDSAVKLAVTKAEADKDREIAEKDLEIRGPGEFFGFRQHGLPQLVLADPIKHTQIAEQAGKEALRLLNEDPALESEENKIFHKIIKKRYMQLDNLTI